MNVSLHYQRCTLLLAAARKNALKNVNAARFFFYKTITRLTNLQQTVLKIKKNKT